MTGPAGTPGVPDPRGPLSPGAQERRRRTALGVVGGVGAVVLLAIAWALGRSVGAGAVVVLLGLVVVIGVLAALLIGSDRRRRAATAPSDLARRSTPDLDLDRVRAQHAQGGTAAAVREVRRQAPWLSLAEAAAVVERLG